MTSNDSEAARREVLETVAAGLPDPTLGLPDSVFEFALTITPMVNVDLLLQDGERRVLLAWREDAYGEGWHVPGGIVRFNEPLHRRIAETARLELGAEVTAQAQPMHVQQFFAPPRGHFISLIFRRHFAGDEPAAAMFWNGQAPASGELGWFGQAPDQLYPAHWAYAAMLDRLTN